jgi:hypothetical protein
VNRPEDSSRGRRLFVDETDCQYQGAEAVGMPGSFFDHTEVTASCARLLRYLGEG